MSRSRKQPYFTDNGQHHRGLKQLHSRIIRREAKVRLLKYTKEYHWETSEEPEMPNWKVDGIHPYTICDFRFYSPSFPKAYRK